MGATQAKELLRLLEGEWQSVAEGAGPGGEPMRVEGSAKNRLVGDYWMALDSIAGRIELRSKSYQG